MDCGDELFCSVRRLDVLQELIDDPQVTEIMVNGCLTASLWSGRTLITRFEKLYRTGKAGRCNTARHVKNVTGLSTKRPIVDARLDNGARVECGCGTCISGRACAYHTEVPDVPITMETLIAWGSITREAAGFAERSGKKRVLHPGGGGTPSAKTTFLKCAY